MTYNASAVRSVRVELTPNQQGALARLEAQQAAPTDLQKGELRALRLCGGEDDRRRCESLQARWGTT